MNPSDRIVTTMPLEDIWTSEKELKANRIAYLTKDDIKELLKKRQVYFIVAN